jgi:hypothetical protein
MRFISKLIIILIIFTFFIVDLYSEELGFLEKVKGTYIPLKNKQITGIEAVKFLFKNKEHGHIEPANEHYICIYLQDNYPIINTIIYGHTLSLETRDIDKDNELELLVFYHAGGNQYALELFEIQEDKLLPFKHQPGSSNMRSIKIIDNKIIVRNLENNNDVRKIVIDNYKIINGDCVLYTSAF